MTFMLMALLIHCLFLASLLKSRSYLSGYSVVFCCKWILFIESDSQHYMVAVAEWPKFTYNPQIHSIFGIGDWLCCIKAN